MTRQLSQAEFDSLQIQAMMLLDRTEFDANAEYRRQCEEHAAAHSHEDIDELLRSRDQLAPIVEECVRRICDHVYGQKDAHRPEHRLAVTRLVMHALQRRQNEDRPPIWMRLIEILAKTRTTSHRDRVARSAANIIDASKMVLYKQRIDRRRYQPARQTSYRDRLALRAIGAPAE